VALNAPLSGVYGEVHNRTPIQVEQVVDLYASGAVSLAVFTRRPLAQSVSQMGKAQHSEKNDMPTEANLQPSPQIVQYIEMLDELW